MNRIACLGAFLLTAFAAAGVAPGQDLAHYLRLRNRNHVDHASSCDALRNVSGTQVLELEGKVNGSCRDGDLTTLLLDRGSGDPQEIFTDFVPDWLVSSDVSARLLVKATRSDESTPLRVVLLDAAKSADVAKFDDAQAAKWLASHPHRHVATPSRLLVRGDGALFGPIARGGSRMERRPTWYLPTSQVTPLYAAFIRRENPRLSDADASVMAENIVGRCIQYNIDPRLVVSIVLVESGFDPASVSSSGAIGLGQLMPGTAQWMGVSDSYDITQNIYGMVKLLHTLRAMFAKQSSSVTEMWEKTIAAYNAGDGAVRRYGGVPPFPVTQAYVRHVLTLYFRLAGQPAG